MTTKKHIKPQTITLQALKLTERAAEEQIAYRTAQKHKDRFACVLIPVGKAKDGKQKFLTRYLDAKTTRLLQASGLFDNQKKDILGDYNF